MKSHSTRHVAILIHAQGTFEDGGYFLGPIAQAWREMGWQVSVQQGPKPVLAADLAILHVDLTQVPAEYLDVVECYPKVLNGRVADISKRKISAQLVQRGDGYDGPVIVKTSCNFGGSREADLARQGHSLGRYLRAAWRRLPWSCRAELPASDYRIFDSARKVPLAVWFNPAFVVERFLPERHEEFYCLRTWVFLGDKETNSLSYAREPIVKSERVVRREVVSEIPEELRKVRRELGFDFGKFDYAIVDGEVVLYDVNRTPTLGNFSEEQYRPRARHLAEGIYAF